VRDRFLKPCRIDEIRPDQPMKSGLGGPVETDSAGPVKSDQEPAGAEEMRGSQAVFNSGQASQDPRFR
jgi:hypothetical protein